MAPEYPQFTVRWLQIGYLIRAGWRPVAGWICGIVLFVNGAILPLTTKNPVDWAGVLPFVGLLIAHGAARTYEKTRGQDQ